jgi:hypothetical protein
VGRGALMNESIGNKTIQLSLILKTLEELHDIVFLMEYEQGRFKYSYFSKPVDGQSLDGVLEQIQDKMDQLTFIYK